MKLYLPSVEYRDAFLTMMFDYQRNGEHKYQVEHIEEPGVFENYVSGIQDYAGGFNLKPGRVQQSTFWLMENNIIYGVSKLRHTLTDALYLEFGHIGYDVPPAHRRKGYGTFLLKLTLAEAASIGLERVMVTCDNDNVGSQKIILKNGGVFENEINIEHNGKTVCRYWIDTKGVRNE